MKILSAGSVANCLELEIYNSRCIFINFASGTESETTWRRCSEFGRAVRVNVKESQTRVRTCKVICACVLADYDVFS